MTGSYDDYERPFEVDSKTKRKMSEMHDMPEWKKDAAWGEDWEEPVDDPKFQQPYPSTDFDHPHHIDREDWW